MQRSEADKGSSTGRKYLVSDRINKRSSAAEAAEYDDEFPALLVAKNKLWAAARRRAITGEIVFF